MKTKILVLASFLVILALFLFATQMPVGIITEEGDITEPFKDKISEAVSEAISVSEVPVDTAVVERAVALSIKILDDGQRTRLTYLFAAYIVIWLVFILYVFHLEQQQQRLDKRLAQLEPTSGDEEV